MAAVHAGETPIKWPPAAKTVRSNMAAVHAGETLIKWPPAAKAVRSTWRRCMPARSADQMAARCEGGAVQHGGGACRRNADQTAADGLDLRAKNRAAIHGGECQHRYGRASQRRGLRRLRPEAGPQSDRIKRKSAEKPVMGKQRRLQEARAATEARAPDHRRSRRMATTASRATKVQGRRMRTSDGIEVGRAVGQLNQDDRRAFRSRCGQILSAPGKFARSHVEICTAASL